MPKAAIATKTGPARVNYTISTPECMTTDRIDPILPTVMFLHPVYMGQYIFQTQFSDPRLRRFNLVAIDTRGHGETLGSVSKDWRCSDAAEDVVAFMDVLKLPACHFFGVSMGAAIALEVAILFPDKVLSAFLVSPASLEEPPQVLEGRQEIYDYWVLGFQDPSRIDEAAISDAIRGAHQLAFNDVQSELTKALNAVTISHAMINFAPERFEEFHTSTVKFFADREVHSVESFRKIRSPVKIVYCCADVAYTLESVRELLNRLTEAGVVADMVTIDRASHFGNATHPKEINSIFHDFVIRNTEATVPSAPESVVSPFQATLVQAGWDIEDRDEDDIQVNSGSR